MPREAWLRLIEECLKLNGEAVAMYVLGSSRIY
jgi:hypothetical protein